MPREGKTNKRTPAAAAAAKSLVVSDPVPAGSQASSRGEAKDSALLSSRDAGLLEPPERYRTGRLAAPISATPDSGI